MLPWPWCVCAALLHCRNDRDIKEQRRALVAVKVPPCYCVALRVVIMQTQRSAVCAVGRLRPDLSPFNCTVSIVQPSCCCDLLLRATWCKCLSIPPWSEHSQNSQHAALGFDAPCHMPTPMPQLSPKTELFTCVCDICMHIYVCILTLVLSCCDKLPLLYACSAGW